MASLDGSCPATTSGLQFPGWGIKPSATTVLLMTLPPCTLEKKMPQQALVTTTLFVTWVRLWLSVERSFGWGARLLPMRCWTRQDILACRPYARRSLVPGRRECILCYQYIARDVVDPVVAEVVDFVAGEQHIVRHDFRAEYDIRNVRVRHRNASCVGSVISVPTTRARANHSGWVHPSVLSAELTCKARAPFLESWRNLQHDRREKRVGAFSYR